MAVINTLVAKSDNIGAAALNLNAKAFEARQTLAGIWDLKPTTTAPPPPESTFQLDMKNATDESVVGEGDERVKVEEKDFMPGGKYRCKLPLPYPIAWHSSHSLPTASLHMKHSFPSFGNHVNFPV